MFVRDLHSLRNRSPTAVSEVIPLRSTVVKALQEERKWTPIVVSEVKQERLMFVRDVHS